MLRGRLKGDAVGLVQLFREVPCPDLMARHLLDLVLADFRESGHHYLMFLVAERDHARRRGAEDEVAILDVKIHEHALNEQLPERWHLDFIFSQAVYETRGDGILAVWATTLIEICTIEQHWDRAARGLPPQDPYLLPGFHPDKEVLNPAWLEPAQQSWSGDLRTRVLPDAASVLEVVTLPHETLRRPADEPHHDVYPGENDAAADVGPWVH